MPRSLASRSTRGETPVKHSATPAPHHGDEPNAFRNGEWLPLSGSPLSPGTPLGTVTPVTRVPMPTGGSQDMPGDGAGMGSCLPTSDGPQAQTTTSIARGGALWACGTVKRQLFLAKSPTPSCSGSCCKSPGAGRAEGAALLLADMDQPRQMLGQQLPQSSKH